MMEWFKENIAAVFGRQDDDSNTKISKRQKLVVKLVLSVLMVAGFAMAVLVQEKSEAYQNKNAPVKKPLAKIELPDTTIDKERRWREHFESIIADQTRAVNDRLQAMEEGQSQLVKKAEESVERDLSETREKLALAQAELISASLELKKVASIEADRANSSPIHRESSMNAQEFEQEIEFDRPKSAANYVPEGIFFMGNLVGGVVVSTALSAPDENSTPVSIKLQGRFDVRGDKLTNLSPLNKIDLKHCRIMGSAYGDLSSERAIIRLEKLVCEENGLIQTSKIAGQVFGPDGYNGIKGTVISTSSKHIKNAALGGVISGLSGAAKGQDGASITGAGLISTKKKGIGDMLGQGALQGASNAGEKVADYYLRQAESMSPVLTIDPGVRVSAQITKGFFVGEVGTHKKIKKAKK